MSSKQQLREQYLPRRKALAQSNLGKKYSRTIREKLSKFINLENPHSVLIYHSVVDEVDVLPLLNLLLENNRLETYLPSTRELAITRITAETELKKGVYSILEPALPDGTLPPEIDLAIIPAVVFDKNGFRLGRGAGWYDQLLAKLEVKIKIGVSFDELIVDKLPRESHDQPVDMIISEKRVIDLR